MAGSLSQADLLDTAMPPGPVSKPLHQMAGRTSRNYVGRFLAPYKSPGVNPVRFPIRAIIFGPISSLR
jgi:hypothetical protein